MVAAVEDYRLWPCHVQCEEDADDLETLGAAVDEVSVEDVFVVPRGQLGLLKDMEQVGELRSALSDVM